MIHREVYIRLLGVFNEGKREIRSPVLCLGTAEL